MKRIEGAAVAVWLLLSAASAAAEVYKWTDADGRVHFGDRPPAGRGESLQLPAPAATAPAPTAEQRLEAQRRLLRAYDEERRQRRDTLEQSRRDAAQRQRNCAQARDDLHSRASAGALYRLGPDGQRVFLDDAERERAMAEARAAVAEWCGKS